MDPKSSRKLAALGGTPVPDDEFCLRMHAVRAAREEIVQHDDAMVLFNESVEQVRADEAGATRH